VLLASAWQPLGLGRLIAGAIGDTVDDPATPPVTETVAEAPPPLPAEPGEPRLLAGRGGNAQTGPVGRLLPEPLRLQVLDSAGVPVPGVVVAFEVVAGQASGMADTTITDADGVVYTPITLPSTPQDVEIVARLAERPEIMTSFMLSAVPATGAEIGGIDGDDQSAPPGRSLPDALLLRVLDEDGAPVEGAEVEFTTESGGIQPQFDLTDADGWAVGRWTLGDELGVQEAIARVTGGAGSVVFRATAVDPAEVEADSTDAASDPDAPSASAPRVARRGWDVGGAMVCVIGAGGRPFCRGGTSASDDVSGIVAVAAGVTHACGLDEDGFAWCWGSNTAGQLGDGSRTSHAGRPVEGTRFARLAAGVEHTCGLDADGRAHCWGRSLSGQLGTGGRDDRTVPVPVASPLRFVGLASGWQHTCGLTGSGQVHCWGLNSEGQLGDGTRVDRLAPVSVAAGGGFQEIAAGSAHTCGLRDGQVYCWGNNQHGQLGSGTSLPATRPGVVPGLPPVVSVVAGASHTCARTAAGEVFCWGQNVHGQLGDGSNEARSAPTPVAGDIRFTSILGGGGITCGRSDQGELWCWGFNQNGQLGDGTRNNRSLPTRVGG
ncbi:MAG: hypothetical protein KJO11_05345, partial [Gemmatimonadetes bacterium]|nr:hypothetical protein [Gemmatimonadota bacterium]NNK64680.1 hypothetical protein [Gemmatimonadota bacterium]